MKEKYHESIKSIPELANILEKCPSFNFANNVQELFNLACGTPENNFFEVTYDLPEKGAFTEVTVARVRNGIAVNYTEAYMRRRDPDCLVVGDDGPTDKKTYKERFGKDFSELRNETFDWLANQELALFAFKTGADEFEEDALAVVPLNAAFFALGLALLQGITPVSELTDNFSPRTVFYVAPPFRHTHLDGKQVVVHNRLSSQYEIFSYNLYPGPSAKKGVYGVLINQGENEGWVVPHCSAVEVVTPYDNIVTFMHEGASGGGKSEMLEQPHRMSDGRMKVGQNTQTGEKLYIEIPRTCELHPVCDDMALCHPSLQKDDGKLWLMDAENGWFLRVDHITEYGTDPDLEKLTVDPPEQLYFVNIDTVPESRALIWEHIEDEPGKRCPNPRVIVPREIYPNIVKRPVGVNYRSFGVRTPVCTSENPSYGIMGLFHILPPALAWLWRLVAPRGFSNPSIVDDGGMSSEGVGSYWAFSTGLKVNQGNLLLEQIQKTSATQFILIPNQNVGVWKTGFMPQWLVRDYLARRGSARFHEEQITPARSPLLGYALKSMRIEGTRIPNFLLEVDHQPEVGSEGYDQGAAILQDFFEDNLKQFLTDDLIPQGRRIIECCLDKGNINDYEAFFPEYHDFVFSE